MDTRAGWDWLREGERGVDIKLTNLCNTFCFVFSIDYLNAV